MTRAYHWLLAPITFLIITIFISVNADDAECDSCTFTLFCWMNGGQREEGCSGPSWLITCCVPQVTRSDVLAPSITQQLPPPPPTQPVGGLRSASGTGTFMFGNTLEEITNFGRQDWLTALPSQHRFFVKSKPQSPLGSMPYNQLQPLLPQQVLTQQQQQQMKQQHLQQQQQFIALNSINFLSGTKPVCGIQPLKSTFQKRIIGGEQASFAEFPWQAHIRIAGFQCGGVLLNHQYIATAAHCVHRAKLSQIIIYLGEYDTKDLDKSEILPKETLGVVERKIHPQFKYMLTQPDRYDIALLKLSRPIVYRDNILPICLPPHGKDYEGALGVVAGWGKTDTSFGKTGTNILQKVYVPIIDNGMCFVWHELKDIILELHDEMFCAGHEQGKMDACLGDSGGPLVVNDGGRWTLVGITSAGFGCAVDHQPGIYHKVSKTVPWIIANIMD